MHIAVLVKQTKRFYICGFENKKETKRFQHRYLFQVKYSLKHPPHRMCVLGVPSLLFPQWGHVKTADSVSVSILVSDILKRLLLLHVLAFNVFGVCVASFPLALRYQVLVGLTHVFTVPILFSNYLYLLNAFNQCLVGINNCFPYL